MAVKLPEVQNSEIKREQTYWGIQYMIGEHHLFAGVPHAMRSKHCTDGAISYNHHPLVTSNTLYGINSMIYSLH